MFKKFKVIKILLVLLPAYLVFGQFVYAESSNFQQQIYPITECNDGTDNDGDGGIDFATDNQCTSWEDNSESEIQSIPPSYPQDEQPIDQSIQEPESTNSTVETIVSDIYKYIEDYYWEPLGSILGVSGSISENLSQQEIELARSTLFFAGIVYLSGLVIAGVYIILKRK